LKSFGDIAQPVTLNLHSRGFLKGTKRMNSFNATQKMTLLTWNAEKIRSMFPQYVSATFFRNMFPQHFSATYFRNIFPQYVSATFFRNIFPQHISATYFRKIAFN
jgi:hypothetical protein